MRTCGRVDSDANDHHTVITDDVVLPDANTATDWHAHYSQRITSSGRVVYQRVVLGEGEA